MSDDDPGTIWEDLMDRNADRLHMVAGLSDWTREDLSTLIAIVETELMERDLVGED